MWDCRVDLDDDDEDDDDAARRAATILRRVVLGGRPSSTSPPNVVLMVVDLSEPSEVGPAVERMRSVALEAYGGGEGGDVDVDGLPRDAAFGRAGFRGVGTAATASKARADEERRRGAYP